MLLTKFFIFLLPWTLVSSDPWDDPISNCVYVYSRQNYVLFAVTNECNEECFIKLYEYFSYMHNNTQTDERITHINFGIGDNITIGTDEALPVYDTKFYNLSQVEDVSEVTLNFLKLFRELPCPLEASKYQALIISEQCTANEIKASSQPENLTECPKNFRFYSLMVSDMGTRDKCMKSAGITMPKENPNANCPSVNPIPVYAADMENLDNDEGDYRGSTVRYTTTIASSKLVVFDIRKDPSFDFFVQRFLAEWVANPENALCMDPSSAMILLTQREVFFPSPYVYTKAVMPMYFAPNNISPFRIIIDDLTEYGTERAFDCNKIIGYLKDYISRPESSSQQFFLFFMDGTSNCADLDLQWNLTNKHLNVYVETREGPSGAETYLPLITPMSKASNHVKVYTSFVSSRDEIIRDYTVCRTETSVEEFEYVTIDSPSTTQNVISTSIEIDMTSTMGSTDAFTVSDTASSKGKTTIIERLTTTNYDRSGVKGASLLLVLLLTFVINILIF